jgi:hypothetical protein
LAKEFPLRVILRRDANGGQLIQLRDSVIPWVKNIHASAIPLQISPIVRTLSFTG